MIACTYVCQHIDYSIAILHAQHSRCIDPQSHGNFLLDLQSFHATLHAAKHEFKHLCRVAECQAFSLYFPGALLVVLLSLFENVHKTFSMHVLHLLFLI